MKHGMSQEELKIQVQQYQALKMNEAKVNAEAELERFFQMNKTLNLSMDSKMESFEESRQEENIDSPEKITQEYNEEEESSEDTNDAELDRQDETDSMQVNDDDSMESTDDMDEEENMESTKDKENSGTIDNPDGIEDSDYQSPQALQRISKTTMNLRSSKRHKKRAQNNLFKAAAAARTVNSGTVK